MSEENRQKLTVGALKILAAASELFYQRGITAVGVDTIAVHSGVTKRTLYDRFGSKDALVVAYLQHRHDDWWARWHARIADAPRPRALTAFDSYAEDAHPSGRGCAFLNAAAELPPSHPGFAVVRDHKQKVRDRLHALIAEDGNGAPSAVAEHVFLLLEGAVAHQGIDGSGARLATARRLAAQLLS